MEAAEQIEHLKLALKAAGLRPKQIVLPEDRQTIIGEMRFHYLDWGTNDRHPIVFLHGGGLNAHTWDVVCLMLRKEYHCLALDQRGHGDSEWSPTADYGLESQLGDVEGFVERLRLKRPLIVGHSMGGFAAMAYASRHSSRIAGLLLVDVGPELNADGAARIRNFLSTHREFESIDTLIERSMAFNPMRNPALLRRSLLHNLRRLPNGNWTWKHDPRRITPDGLRQRQQEISKAVSRITCPTLVLRGASSDVFSDESAEKFAAMLPNGRWIRVENAGHTIQGDNPRGLLAATRSFLSELGI